MPVKLKGSCHCGKVRYSVDSNTPVPYQLCSCYLATDWANDVSAICRKVGGYTGSVNIMGLKDTLVVKGEKYLKNYTPAGTKDIDGKPYSSTRFFCGECSSMLYLYDPAWVEWVYPFASSIDVPLPKAPEILVIMRASCPDYVPILQNAKVHDKYGGMSIEEWHRDQDLWVK